MMRSPTLHSPLQQHQCLMITLPQARHTGRLPPRPAPPRYGLPLLGALVCLLLVVGTSQAAWVNLPGIAFTRLCPSHYRGDREYAGHGPQVTVTADLSTSGEVLSLDLYMDQSETRSDWSAAFLGRNYFLYGVQSGQVIRFIWNATHSEVTYVDTDHALDRFFPADTLVQEFAIMGDTSGNDIGNCTADDAYLSVYLEPLWLWVE
jgi:hypothetical protein